MGEIQSMDHTVIAVNDLWWAEWFYTEVLGGTIGSRQGLTTDQLLRGRRRMARRLQKDPQDPKIPAPHSSIEFKECVLPIFIHQEHVQEPPPDRFRGTPRVGFQVVQEQFHAAVEKLKAKGVPYEGPVRHDEGSPLGESIYFKDPSGNFIELCWMKAGAGKRRGAVSHHT